MNNYRSLSVPGRLRKLATSCVLGTAAAAFLYALPLVDGQLGSGLFMSTVQAADSERRAAPEARQSETLTRRVYERIEEVMELREAEDYVGARAKLGEVREMYNQDRLNNREKQVMFQFYANLDQIEENYAGALSNYLEIMKLEGLTQEIQEQTLTQIGSLHFMLENYQEAIDTFNELLAIALEPDPGVYLRIAYAYYSLEDYVNTAAPLLTNMEMLRAVGEEIPYNTYSLLKSVYLLNEDFPKAYQAIREMLILYNDPRDWLQLLQAAGAMDKFEEQALLYYTNYIGGFLASSSDYRNMASILSNQDNPYGCAKAMDKALDDGLVDADEENYFLTASCYRLAREDAKAVPFMELAAEMSADGEKYYTLGVTHMVLSNFEEAVEAFEKAQDKGDLRSPGNVQIQHARALMELNRYDEALTVARLASRDRDASDLAQTWITHLTREKERYETIERRKRELAEFYR